MILMAGGQTPPKATSTIIEQTWYFALPGKAEEVYQWRESGRASLASWGAPCQATTGAVSRGDLGPELLAADISTV
jgi:hypothetical protein